MDINKIRDETQNATKEEVERLVTFMQGEIKRLAEQRAKEIATELKELIEGTGDKLSVRSQVFIDRNVSLAYNLGLYEARHYIPQS